MLHQHWPWVSTKDACGGVERQSVGQGAGCHGKGRRWVARSVKANEPTQPTVKLVLVTFVKVSG